MHTGVYLRNQGDLRVAFSVDRVDHARRSLAVTGMADEHGGLLWRKGIAFASSSARRRGRVHHAEETREQTFVSA